MHTSISLTSLLLFSAFAMSVASAETKRAELSAAELRQNFSGDIRRAARRNRVPGVSVVLVDAGRVVWSESFGLSDAEANQALGNQHRWPLGDSSKLITTLTALVASQRGELELDDELDQLWPDNPINGQQRKGLPVTPRRLMSHHSGLAPNRLQGLYQNADSDPDDAALDAYMYLAQPTGRIFAYSNLGYELLGQLLAHRGGLPYPALAEARVMQPLGMRNSGFEPGPQPVRGHHKRSTQALLSARDLAALGVWASTDDIARLLVELSRLDNGTSALGLDPLLAQQALSVQNEAVKLDFSTRTGLAWQLFDSARPGVGRVARIGSNAPRYRGEIRLLRDHQLAVAVFANSSDAGELVDQLSSGILDQALLAKAGIEPISDSDRDATPVLPDRVALPEHARSDPLALRYVSPLGLIQLERDGDRHHADFLGREVTLEQREDGWYSVRYRLLGIIPLNFGFLNRVLLRPVQVDGERMLLAWFGGQIYPVASYFEAEPPDARYMRLLGDYQVSNPDLLFEQLDIRRIRAEDCGGVLCFSYELPFMIRLRARLPVIPDGNGHLRVPGIGPLLGERLEIFEHEGRPGIRYSGYELIRNEG